MEKQPAVYILASKRNGTLYIRVTSKCIRQRKAADTSAEKTSGFLPTQE